MIKDLIERKLRDALREAANELNLPAEAVGTDCGLRLERPRNADHGDYAVNVSSLARYAKLPPLKIAETLTPYLENQGLPSSTIAGFINFRLGNEILLESLVALLKNPAPGRNNSLADISMLLEYVSANPTGPLHIGHGRWAALGDSIKRILEHNGATVTPEFYINDAGVQMMKIGLSLYYRALEVLKAQGKITRELPTVEYPYPGEYVTELARHLLETPEHERAVLELWERHNTLPGPDNLSLETADPFVAAHFKTLIRFAREELLGQQQALLKRMGVTFEAWFSELEYIHQRGLIEEALAKLKANGFAYEQDGALWFRSTDFGDEKDRVLIKSDGSYTYLAADIAYHDHKYGRQDDDGHPQYNRYVNIWGADHHGYIARLRGAIESLGHNANQFEVLLGQLVNLIVDGEKTRMGKRRRMLTLEDVIEEVGVDATRFWMVSKSADTALDFDVDLAMSATSDNPVFYAQYAHARCCSIVRNATEVPVSAVSENTPSQPHLSMDDLRSFERSLSVDDLEILFESIQEPAVTEALKALFIRLDNFEDVVRDAARARAPHQIARYTLDLAADFHSFYNVCRILTPEPHVTRARLMLISAIRKVLAQALELLGVSAPVQM